MNDIYSFRSREYSNTIEVKGIFDISQMMDIWGKNPFSPPHARPPREKGKDKHYLSSMQHGWGLGMVTRGGAWSLSSKSELEGSSPSALRPALEELLLLWLGPLPLPSAPCWVPRRRFREGAWRRHTGPLPSSSSVWDDTLSPLLQGCKSWKTGLDNYTIVHVQYSLVTLIFAILLRTMSC